MKIVDCRVGLHYFTVSFDETAIILVDLQSRQKTDETCGGLRCGGRRLLIEMLPPENEVVFCCPRSDPYPNYYSQARINRRKVAKGILI